MEPEISINLMIYGLLSEKNEKDLVVKTSPYLKDAACQIKEYIKNEFFYANPVIMLLNGSNIESILQNDKMFMINNGDRIKVIPYISGG